ncbi:MAG: rRNA maturation RNase YbeY, partial [Achromobacter sp.]|nr:rRNA maturation RNase YbeY [Achromobacter sp.]
TNVLTFEYGIDPEGTLRADIVLCHPVLLDEARQHGKPVLHHAAHLTIHGVLHALGYDHLDDAQAHEMESLETRLLARLNIPDPYNT